jgi:hypothetical protein
MADKRITYSGAIWQDNMQVAYAIGLDPRPVLREILHYAVTYSQDGAVEIRWSHNLRRWLKRKRELTAYYELDMRANDGG